MKQLIGMRDIEARVPGLLLEWYHKNKRDLPFRRVASPYHVWVSEVMLQQTRVTAVLPYYHRFVAALPDVAALAACEEERLHKLWEGLGYYSRARNLQKAARLIIERHGGQLPASYDALLALPGIGPYTAGAIASIAFGLPYAAVDGNVLRVTARLCGCAAPVDDPAVKRTLTAQVQATLPGDAPGDYNQALMELGALVCLPGAPACGRCPLAAVCQGRRQGDPGRLPVKTPKAAKKELPVLVAVVRREDEVLLQKRPAGGLLAGLWQPLAFEGETSEDPALLARKLAFLFGGPVVTPQAPLPTASHMFTHRVWRMGGWLCQAPAGTPAPEGPFVWANAQALREQYTIPGAFRAFLPAMGLASI